MTKKAATQRPATVLRISNEEFVEKLKARILIGEEFKDLVLRSVEEYNQKKSDVYLWNTYNAEFLKRSFNNSENEYLYEYKKSQTDWTGFIYGGERERSDQQKLVDMITRLTTNLNHLLNRAELIDSEIPKMPMIHGNNNIADKTQVFIVHGRDNEAKIKTARFIEKLGIKAVILHEQPNTGKTIIEKIEEYSNVGFAIILYTPCDIGGLNEQNLRARARQNVVFEHGYLMGKIGRRNVCALVKGDLEKPNDISGIVYIDMDEAEGWQLSVAKELKTSGYQIDLNRLH